MRIEMLEGEREILRAMNDGQITPACARLFARVREKLLLGGHSYDMPKETLALIAVMADAAASYVPERKETVDLAEKLNERPDPSPIDEMSKDEIELHASQNKSLNSDPAGDEYTGNRIKWETDFKSTTSTPIAKLEKGRPISFIDPKDNKRYFGRFVKVHPKDKRMANVLPNGKKVPFPVPMKNVDVTDLSPPSTIPLAVQI